MAKKKHTKTVEVVNPICCGLDVHQDSISACLMTQDKGGREETEIREFGTFFNQIVKLKNWLVRKKCPIVAMESTGVYWRPVHNVLEKHHIEVLVVNPRHHQNLPGRKTDIMDSQWLAGLLRHGLCKASFIPAEEVRDWRDLLVQRKKFVREIADNKRRALKVLETANVKLSSVTSDAFGVSGRALMDLLLCKPLSEIAPSDVAACLRTQLKKKKKEVFESLQGFFRAHHRVLLRPLLETIDFLEKRVKALDALLFELMKDHHELLERLQEMPGVGLIGAMGILGGVGTTLETFRTSGHLCSWAGLTGSHHESAGKRVKGRRGVNSREHKSWMVELAWAAVKTKGTYYRDKYFRLKARRGPKRAIVAIARRMMEAIFHIVKNGAHYRELGEDYLLRRNEQATYVRLMHQARRLGYSLTPLPEAA